MKKKPGSKEIFICCFPIKLASYYWEKVYLKDNLKCVNPHSGSFPNMRLLIGTKVLGHVGCISIFPECGSYVGTLLCIPTLIINPINTSFIAILAISPNGARSSELQIEDESISNIYKNNWGTLKTWKLRNQYTTKNPSKIRKLRNKSTLILGLNTPLGNRITINSYLTSMNKKI